MLGTWENIEKALITEFFSLADIHNFVYAN